MSRRRRRSLAMLLGIVVPCGGLVVAECSLALLGLPRESRLEPFVGVDGIERWTREGRFVTEPESYEPTRHDRVALTAPTAGGVVRVVVVGESTAAGFPFYPYLSFGRVLEWMLRSLGADGVEVVNLARAADPSREVVAVAAEALAFEPDVLVVSTGHNEFQWPYCEAYRERSAGSAFAAWLRDRRLTRLAMGSRAGGRRSAEAGESPVPRADPARPVADEPFVSAAQKATGVAEMRARLEALFDRAESAGVAVLLLGQVSNERTFPPVQSAFSLARTGTVESESLQRAILALEAEVPTSDDEAAAAWRAVLEREPELARAHFALGNALLDESPQEARAHFQRALDFDGYPNRASSAVNAMLREVAAHESVTFCDVDVGFSREAQFGIPGEDLFLDHCHPTVEATFLLAATVLPQLLPLLGERAPDARALPLQEHWTSAPTIDAALTEFGIDRTTLAEQAVGAAQVVLSLAHLESPSALSRLNLARSGFEKALRVAPDHPRALLGSAVVAALLGEREAALAALARAREVEPQTDVWLTAIAESPVLQQALHKCGLEVRGGSWLPRVQDREN